MRGQPLLRPPERDDVVVHLVDGGDLDQHDRALAPVADRLDPQAGAPVVQHLRVEIVGKGALPLHQAEAVRVDVAEIADLQVARVAQRAPDLLAAPGEQGQSLRVVGGGAPVVDGAPVVGIEEVHAGQGGDPGRRDVDARVEHALHVEHGLLAGTHGEAIGAGSAAAVEQGVDHQRADAGLRPLQPERAEPGELLALRVCGADRQAARREPVDLPLGHGAEVAGAEEDADLVVGVGPVDRRMDAEPREAELLGRGRGGRTGGGIGVVEQLRGVRDPDRAAVGDLEDVDALAVQEAAGEELGLERQVLAAPQRVLGAEPDAAVLVIGQVVEGRGQRRVRRLERLARHRLRQAPDGGGVERAGRRRLDGRRRLGRAGAGPGQGEEWAAGPGPE